MSHKIFPYVGAKTDKAVLCSQRFTSQGLRLDALRFSLADTNVFPNCGSTSGAKLTKVDLSGLDLSLFCLGNDGPARLWRSAHHSSQWRAFREWRKRERIRAELSGFSDRELRDVGVTRSEIDYIASNHPIEPRGI